MAEAAFRTFSQLLLALSLLVGSNLYFVAAQTHAAPSARTLLAYIEKMDGASLTLADATGGDPDQQRYGIFGERAEDVVR
jgi:hypothetical protein